MQFKIRVLSGMFAMVEWAVLAALLAVAASCDRLPVTSTPAPTATRTLVSTPEVTPAETPAVEIPADILSARDALITLVRNQYPDKAPADGVVWIGQSTAPPGAIGMSAYEFADNGWLMTVAALSISPGQVLYEMALDNPQRGLHWTGRLDADHRLLELNLNLAVEVLVARNTVLAYVQQHYPGEAPAENVAWIGERTTPAGLLGHETCQFTSASDEAATGGWTMTVGYDVVRSGLVVYEVDLRQTGNGFVWHGQVDAEGTVIEHR